MLYIYTQTQQLSKNPFLNASDSQVFLAKTAWVVHRILECVWLYACVASGSVLGFCCCLSTEIRGWHAFVGDCRPYASRDGSRHPCLGYSSSAQRERGTQNILGRFYYAYVKRNDTNLDDVDDMEWLGRDDGLCRLFLSRLILPDYRKMLEKNCTKMPHRRH